MDKVILQLVATQIKTSLVDLLGERILEKQVNGKVSLEDLTLILEEFLESEINLNIKQSE